MAKVKKIPKRVFDYIEKFIPFSSVDIIINYKNQGIILTKRAIRPYNGWWHLPGSVVLKNEKMENTVKRSALEELGLEIAAKPEFIQNYELFTPRRHYITHLYLAKSNGGKINLDRQSSSFVIINPRDLPDRVIPIQRIMINDVIKRGLL